MIRLGAGPLDGIVVVGAHCDDIAIGAGGTLLTICLARPGIRVDALVLSGGGSNGAFGAGFLNGWTKTGDRPTFKLVTGISTGALIAPFAFLGSDYDPRLEKLFTTVTNKDIYRIRSPFAVFKKDSLARTDPLALRIEEVIDEEILRAIAAEHRRGRRLFVGTTNLDAQRIVVWNMGAIATSGQPGAIDLFRQVLLASASIPVRRTGCSVRRRAPRSRSTSGAAEWR